MKSDKPQFYVGLLGAGILITFGAYYWFVKSPYFEPFNLWTQSNLVLFYVSLFVIKFVGLIWPPLPGGVFVLGSIPIIGWSNAYLIDFGASASASSIAFVLGRKYGMPLISKITNREIIEKIQKIKIKKEREFETIFLLRVFGGAVLVEIVSYASGLFRLSYKNFILGTLLSHLAIGIPFYFFVGSIFSGKNLIFGIITAAILALIIYKFKDRYLA